MKLSNRKQLLEEADMTLKSLLKEAPMSAREQKQYDKAIAKLKELKSEFKKALKPAIAELTKNEADMQKIIDILQTKNMTLTDASPLIQKMLPSFWNYNKNSSLSKAIDVIQDFGETAEM